MHWRIKGSIQKVLGHVPGGGRAHRLLQSYAGGLRDFARECDVKIDDWELMMGHLETAKMPVRDLTLLEMGTGWYPTFPVCLHLSGAARIITLDLNRHLDASLSIALAERLAMHVPRIARLSGRPEPEVERQRSALATYLRHGASLAAATSGAIRYEAPADAADTGLPDASVDVVFSNSVLEHVPPRVIEDCLREAYRILKPGGIVLHSVNCGDHYAYFDRTIHQLHYLKYSDRAWKKWDNAFLYQNRLRAVDFVRMTERAGFTIEVDTSRAKPERLRQLDAMTIDPSLAARYTREELAVTSIDFVGRKPAVEMPSARVSSRSR